MQYQNSRYLIQSCLLFRCWNIVTEYLQSSIFFITTYWHCKRTKRVAKNVEYVEIAPANFINTRVHRKSSAHNAGSFNLDVVALIFRMPGRGNHLLLGYKYKNKLKKIGKVRVWNSILRKKESLLLTDRKTNFV